MPEKERLVLTFYYYEELTMREIGKVLNISESRVCQLYGKGLMKLKGKLEQLSLIPPLREYPSAVPEGAIHDSKPEKDSAETAAGGPIGQKARSREACGGG
ncbi:MAG: hypothetical protein MZV70_17055 [Desulfobacterales bacterium]|nr:hypothetical protein [Desulfobacterales bacterium]